MRTRQEWLDTFTGEHTFDVRWTARGGNLDGTLSGELQGIRADREGQVRTRTMLVLTNPDGPLRGIRGPEITYEVTER